MSEPADARPGRRHDPDDLTPNEERVLNGVRRGLTNADIAIELGVSPEEVKAHVGALLAKLGRAERRELADLRLSGVPRFGRRPAAVLRRSLAAAIAIILAGLLVWRLVPGGEDSAGRADGRRPAANAADSSTAGRAVTNVGAFPTPDATTTLLPSRDTWDALYRRPVTIARLRPGEPCPVTPSRPIGPYSMLGGGPVHLRGDTGIVPFTPEEGLPARLVATSVLLLKPHDYTEPVLIRGRRIDGPGALWFRVGDAPREAFEFPERGTIASSDFKAFWQAFATIVISGEGCYALQLDAPGSSHRLVFQAIRRAPPVIEPSVELVAPPAADFAFSVIGLSGLQRTYVARGSRLRAIGQGRAPAWSPDGKQVALTGRLQVRVVGVGKVITTLYRYGPGARDPVWSPAGGALAFVAPFDYYIPQVDVARAGVPESVRLTEPPGRNWQASWSPDGRRIAFVSERDPTGLSPGENPDIYVMHDDGSEQTRLTTSPGFDAYPAWSPDSRTIVYESNSGSGREIWVMDADGSDRHSLAASGATDWFPAWSPDGHRIAFSSDREGRFRIYVMDAGGSDLIRLTDGLGSDWAPAWSPDGRHIGFLSTRDGYAELYVMRQDGSDVTRVTRTTDGYVDSFAWAPR